MGNLGSYDLLKTCSDFTTVYSGAIKWHNKYTVVFYMPTCENRVGFIASKKVGNAVKRNLAKRRLRAIFFDFQDILNSGMYVFVAKESIHESDYKSLKESLKWSFKRLGCLKI